MVGLTGYDAAGNSRRNFSVFPEKLKPQTAYSFGIGGEEKLGHEMAGSAKSTTQHP
jgi:hypothetical protein